jgi:gamma-glutamyltranspeptidase/glutathione hydrolase
MENKYLEMSISIFLFEFRARCGVLARNVLCASCLAIWSLAPAATAPPAAAIASAHPLATEAGYEMLRRGGNAFDAAVAVAAALAVVEPYSSGLGGGGFWLLHRAADDSEVMIDARETAPAGIALSMYLDSAGKPIPRATLQGGKAAAIPGAPAGIVHLARKYGKLPLAQTLAPAIALARDGFKVDPRYARVAKQRERFLTEGVNTARAFLDGNQAPKPGYLLRQPQLAATLEAIAREGHAAFYRGPIAQSLVAAVNAAGGVWSLSDLEEYKITERTPLRFSFRGATIITAPLPSGGGATLAQALNILEQFPPADARDAAGAHLVIEALRRGFEDRALYLGDSDFVQVPLARLTSKSYAKSRAATIDPAAATPSDRLSAGAALISAGNNTTHYSIIDADGNRVGATLSINFLFGAGIVAGDTGVLLNDEMDDFALLPEIPNVYRLRGSEANRIAPRKRPLSSMTPTFVEDERGVLVLGAPGGPRIVSQVLLGILDYMNHSEIDLQRMVAAPRYHHQYWPDLVEIEPDSFAAEWRAALAARKHKLQVTGRKWGNMQAVFKSKRDGSALAASDPRGLDLGWY